MWNVCKFHEKANFNAQQPVECHTRLLLCATACCIQFIFVNLVFFIWSEFASLATAKFQLKRQIEYNQLMQNSTRNVWCIVFVRLHIFDMYLQLCRLHWHVIYFNCNITWNFPLNQNSTQTHKWCHYTYIDSHPKVNIFLSNGTNGARTTFNS